MRPRAVVLTAFIAAVVVFCVVQDRVTAAGARRYVALQRLAVAGEGPRVSMEAIVAPAVRRSVQQGLLWAGVVMGAGLLAAAVVRHREGA